MKTTDKLLKKLTDAIAEADDYRRRNPSRWTSDGRLKRKCAHGKHKPYGDSALCERCGVRVDASLSACQQTSYT